MSASNPAPGRPGAAPPPHGVPARTPRPARLSSAHPGGTRTAASPLPLLVAAGALLVSLVIAVVVAATPASIPIRFLGIPLPLVTSGAWWLSFIGYLLTPVVVLACYGWDAVGQRNGLRANRNFVLRPSWRRGLQWLTGAAIVVGAWHVLNLSVPLSEAWGFS